MNTRFFFSFLLVLAAVSVCLAGAPPPPPRGGPACWPPPCVPIDGGISLLVAAGVLYGGKKLYSHKKSKDSI